MRPHIEKSYLEYIGGLRGGSRAMQLPDIVPMLVLAQSQTFERNWNERGHEIKPIY